MLAICNPMQNIGGKVTITVLMWFDRSRERLEKWVTGIDENIIEGDVAILMLLDNLSQGSVSEESGVLGTKCSGKQVRKDKCTSSHVCDGRASNQIPRG